MAQQGEKKGLPRPAAIAIWIAWVLIQTSLFAFIILPRVLGLPAP